MTPPIAGCLRTLERIADGSMCELHPPMAKVIMDYIAALEKKCQGPQIQGPNREGSHG